MKNAYLFDIDGTLLYARGIGKLAFEIAIKNTFGSSYSLEKEDFSGRTDKDILFSFLERMNLKESEIIYLLPQLYENYLIEFEKLAESNKSSFLVFPGVREILKGLKGECIGLLTGNLIKSAYIKLRIAMIEEFFPYGVGAFGNESRNRTKLLPIAIKRMKEYYKVDNFNKVWVIGDSSKDIICAKENKAFSLIVATGKEKKEELAKYSPDYLFDNFCEVDKILSILKC
ncbi:MAG: HAD family hydrolase [Brevinematia bacterium]